MTPVYTMVYRFYSSIKYIKTIIIMEDKLLKKYIAIKPKGFKFMDIVTLLSDNIYKTTNFN